MILHIPSKNSGLTLIELLVTLAIAAVLLSVAVPSFSNFLSTGKLSSATNAFYSTVNFARGAAASRNDIIAVCFSDANGCNTSWTGTISAFVDTNRNDDLDANDVLLKIEDTGNPDLKSTLSAAVSFDGAGFLRSSASSIVICDAESNLSGVNIIKTGGATLFSRSLSGVVTNINGTVMACA